MQRGGVLLAAALLVACLSAQQSPPSAHELARRVDLHYDRLHTLKTVFTETYEGLGINRTESGTLLLRKPGRMKWVYSSPPGKLFLLDGKYAWYYSPGDSQVQRIQASQLNDLRSPLRFLLGHTKLEKELNNLTLASGPNGLYTLSGQPKGQQQRVQRLSLNVTADGTIEAIKIEETDGATTLFTFSNEEPDVLIPAQTFHFTPPPGVPVVEALPPV